MSDRPPAHPSSDRLAAFRAGRLSTGEAAQVERHLAGCPACREQVGDDPPARSGRRVPLSTSGDGVGPPATMSAPRRRSATMSAAPPPLPDARGAAHVDPAITLRIE